MAIFNDEPNAVNPTNFIGWSKVGEQPKSDTSTGIALKTAGEGLDIAATDADKYVKLGLDSSLYKQIDEKRDSLISDLKTFNAGTPTAPSANPDASSAMPINPMQAQSTYGYQPQSLTPQSLLSPAQPSVPGAIQSGLQRASVLGQASASKPDLQALYDGQLDAIAKNMRAQFPGYRPYIDQQMSLITGKNPANAEVTSLLDSYTKNIALQKEEKTKTLTDIDTEVKTGMNYGGKSAADMRAWYLQHQNEPDAANKVYQFINTGNAFKYKFEQMNNAHTLETNDKASDLEDAKTAAAYSGRFHTAETLKTVNLQVNGGEELPLNEITRRVQRGDLQLNPHDLAQLPGIISAAKIQALDAFDKDMDAKPRDKDPLSVRLGATEHQAQRLAIGKRFDDYAEALTHAGHGAATFLQRFTSLEEQGAKSQLYNEPSYKGAFLAQKAIIDTGGDKEMSQKVLQKILGLQIPGDTAISGIGNSLKLLGQPGQWKGDTYTVSQAIGEGRDSLPKSAAPATFQAYLNTVDHLRDPSTPPKLKLNAVSALYGEKNKDLLDNFDTNDKWGVFNRNTMPDVSREVRNLNHAGAWDAYKGWAEDSFSKHLLETGTISDLKGYASDGLWGSIPKNIDLAYNNKTKTVSALLPGTQKDILTAAPSDLNTAQIARLPMIRQRLKDLNQGLNNLNNIYSLEGAPDKLDAKLLDKLDGLAETMQGVPAKLKAAIINSHAPEKEEDTVGPFDKKNKPITIQPDVPRSTMTPKDEYRSHTVQPPISNFAEDFNYLSKGNLKDFINNPTGAPIMNSDEPVNRHSLIKGNLSDQPILGMSTEEIPEGADLKQYYDHRPKPRKK